MYHFSTFIKVNEVVPNESSPSGFEHTDRWAFLTNSIIMPFVPSPGVGIRFNSESSSHNIVEIIYDQEAQQLELYLDMIFETAEKYENVISDLIDNEGWEVINKNEPIVPDTTTKHGDIGNN